MARTRSFDEGAVLATAMQLFRRNGYAAVSIGDIAEATGLTVGSLYNAFEDKRGIFDAAFAQYNRQVFEGRIARYARPEDGLAGLRKLFLTLLQEPGGTSYGCLITNSAIEFSGDGAAHPNVDEAFETLLHALRAHVAEALALRLLALYQGVLVLVRAGFDHAKLRKMINHQFDAMERDQ